MVDSVVMMDCRFSATTGDGVRVAEGIIKPKIQVSYDFRSFEGLFYVITFK